MEPILPNLPVDDEPNIKAVTAYNLAVVAERLDAVTAVLERMNDKLQLIAGRVS